MEGSRLGRKTGFLRVWVVSTGCSWLLGMFREGETSAQCWHMEKDAHSSDDVSVQDAGSHSTYAIERLSTGMGRRNEHCIRDKNSLSGEAFGSREEVWMWPRGESHHEDADGCCPVSGSGPPSPRAL